MSLFLSSGGVNENRKILLCKTSGGGTEICEIKNKNTARGEDSNFVRVGPRVSAAAQGLEIGGVHLYKQPYRRTEIKTEVGKYWVSF